MFRITGLSSIMPQLSSFAMLACGVFMLNACGGGNSVNPPTPPPRTPPPPILTVAIATTSPALDVSQSDLLIATVSHDPKNKGVKWTITCASGVTTCGAMAKASSASGTPDAYSAPSNIGAAESLTVTATSVSDLTKSSSVQIAINPAPALVNPAPAQPPPGNVGQYFSLDLTKYVQNGTQPMTWSIKSGTLPAGLTLKPDGSVSGTPTTTATSGLQRRARRDVPGSTTASLVFTSTDSGSPRMPVDVPISITIDPAEGAIMVALASKFLAIDMSQSDSLTATVSNDQQHKGVTWAVTCPNGVSACGAMANASSASGVSDTYSAPSSVDATESFTVTATSVADTSKSASVQIVVNQAPSYSRTGPYPVTGYAGQRFRIFLSGLVQGGSYPFRWSLRSGILPTGLTLGTNPETGYDELFGILPGVSPAPIEMVFTGVDSGHPGLPVDVPVSLTIAEVPALTLDTTSLPGGKVGADYGYQKCHTVEREECIFGYPLNASGGNGTYVWTWAAAPGSSLPPGLDIRFYYWLYPRDEYQVVGKPTAAGTYNVIVTVTDSELPTAKHVSVPFAITISP
jgi:large repetitive protein